MEALFPIEPSRGAGLKNGAAECSLCRPLPEIIRPVR
jgi:hypothetical protein